MSSESPLLLQPRAFLKEKLTVLRGSRRNRDWRNGAFPGKRGRRDCTAATCSSPRGNLRPKGGRAAWGSPRALLAEPPAPHLPIFQTTSSRLPSPGESEKDPPRILTYRHTHSPAGDQGHLLSPPASPGPLTLPLSLVFLPTPTPDFNIYSAPLCRVMTTHR